jgi:hypothetical protein
MQWLSASLTHLFLFMYVKPERLLRSVPAAAPAADVRDLRTGCMGSADASREFASCIRRFLQCTIHPKLGRLSLRLSTSEPSTPLAWPLPSSSTTLSIQTLRISDGPHPGERCILAGCHQTPGFRLPTSTSSCSHRHAAPSGPWPWMDLATDFSVINQATPPSTPGEDGLSDWSEYPQNLFPNWKRDQVIRCRILLDPPPTGRSTIYNIDVVKDDAFDTHASSNLPRFVNGTPSIVDSTATVETLSANLQTEVSSHSFGLWSAPHSTLE